MADFALQTADPLGLGSITNGPILVTSLRGGDRNEYAEVLGGTAQYILSARQVLRPIEEWAISYELLSGASFSVALGVAVNTDYLVTSVSGASTPDGYPTVNVVAMKPSAANKIKAYPNPVTFAMTGGFGVINKFAGTAALDFVSVNASVSMLSAEAMEETGGDFLVAGIYRYGFKLEWSGEAYGAITIPAGHVLTDEDDSQSRDGWRTFAKSSEGYLDAI